MKLTTHADGEISLDVLDDVRSRDVYVVQSVASGGRNVHDDLMELFLTISALKRASAERITAVLPYLPYTRQEEDHDASRPLAAADVSRVIIIN